MLSFLALMAKISKMLYLQATEDRSWCEANSLLKTGRSRAIVRPLCTLVCACANMPVIMKVRGSIPIEIRKSAIYSIGEAEDGRPLIWVSGAGGWYEINPSASYKRMYTTICEAITMYYTVVDIYEKSRPRKGKKSKPQATMDELGQVFQKVSHCLVSCRLASGTDNIHSMPPEPAMDLPLMRCYSAPRSMLRSSLISSGNRATFRPAGSLLPFISGWRQNSL